MQIHIMSLLDFFLKRMKERAEEMCKIFYWKEIPEEGQCGVSKCSAVIGC
jgi:hypothetical protein